MTNRKYRKRGGKKRRLLIRTVSLPTVLIVTSPLQHLEIKEFEDLFGIP